MKKKTLFLTNPNEWKWERESFSLNFCFFLRVLCVEWIFFGQKQTNKLVVMQQQQQQQQRHRQTKKCQRLKTVHCQKHSALYNNYTHTQTQNVVVEI